MEQPNSENIGLQLRNALFGAPGEPANKGAVGFGSRIFPMLGITSIPQDAASNAEQKLLGTTAMTETRPDETTLSGRAEARMQYEATKQQQNLEDISFGAIPYISENAKTDEVDEDWLANFFTKSRIVSNKEMQKLWSQILAGEANRPESFSIKTLNTLSTLTQRDAQLFKQICSFVWIDEEQKPTTIMINKMMSVGNTYNLTGDIIFHLAEIGLISQIPNGISVAGKNVSYSYHGKLYKIENKSPSADKTLINNLQIGTINLTQVGMELFSICTSKPNWEYAETVINRWKLAGFEVIES